MNRVAALLCVFSGSIFTALALLVLFSKLASPSLRAVLFVAAFALAGFGCFRAATRLGRPERRDS